MTCRPANLLIFIPTGELLDVFPAWYIVYKGDEDKAYPVYIRNLQESLTYSLTPAPDKCNTLFNTQLTGRCQLIYAFCEDPVNVYGRQTEDLGHREQIISLSGVVTKPYNKPFPYQNQQTYVAIKDYGTFNYKDQSDTENTTLFLTTFRIIPQEKWGLNKAFGTPIEMIDRVIQKDWNLSLQPQTTSVTVPENITLDSFGRIISLSTNRTGQMRHQQNSTIFAIITTPSILAPLVSTPFIVEGDLLTTIGSISVDISYPDNTTPGVIFSV